MRAHGHEMFTPSYTGIGERSHLLHSAMGRSINLDTHITDVLQVLKFEDLRDVILLGHSYGGMVATGVADRAAERIAQVVYLDAFVPKHTSTRLQFSNNDKNVMTTTSTLERNHKSNGLTTIDTFHSLSTNLISTVRMSQQQDDNESPNEPEQSTNDETGTSVDYGTTSSTTMNNATTASTSTSSNRLNGTVGIPGDDDGFDGKSFYERFQHMLADIPTRRALMVGCGLMLIQQWSGVNT